MERRSWHGHVPSSRLHLVHIARSSKRSRWVSIDSSELQTDCELFSFLGMVPVGMFMNMNNVPPRYFQQQQQSAIQQAAKQSRTNRKMPMVGGGGASQANRNSQQYRGRNSQPGPLTQGGMSQMMSQPGFSLSQQPDFSQDFAGGDFAPGGQSQGDGLLSQDFTNSQGPDKFYSNFHSQSGNNFWWKTALDVHSKWIQTANRMARHMTCTTCDTFHSGDWKWRRKTWKIKKSLVKLKIPEK